MTNHAQLIDKLLAATGPDRRLDIETGVLWIAPPFNLTEKQLRNAKPPCPEFTGSVDAALSLVEQMLPGWGYRIGTCCVSDDAFIFPDYNCSKHGERLKKQFPRLADGTEWADLTDIDLRPSGCLPIAILLSLLTALQAIQKTENEASK